MKRLLKFWPLAIILIVIVSVWLWWNRPQKVDMTAYVPADSLVYMEANSLPDIAGGLGQTDAWKALAAPAGVQSDFSNFGWLSRFAAWTGIGPSDLVVLSRAQVAVTVMGLDLADAGDTLKIKPRAALVIETHTGQSRARAAIEKRVGDFAERAYGQPLIERKESDGAQWTTWTAPSGERRIIAAVMESVAVIGNDEQTVRDCLAVRRGERPSLAGNAQLEEMRARVAGRDALTFGYIPPSGLTKILSVYAPLYAVQFSNDPRVQSAAASMLPSMASKLFGSFGWSARFVGGAVEDRYFLGVQNGLDTRLREPLAASPDVNPGANEMLPSTIYSLSRYNYRDPATAWRGLNAALSSQLGALYAGIITSLMDSLLKPYGIDEPDKFLSAIGPEIVTARLDDSGASTVTIVAARDESALREFVAKRLGPKPHTEHIGDADLLISADEARGAACFVAGHLITGSASNVRRCLEARAQGRTLTTNTAFQKTTQAATITNAPVNAVTYTSDGAPARAFISMLAAQSVSGARTANRAEFDRALGQLAYAASETRLVEGGFEKTTRSAFGQFGTLATQFAPDSSRQK